MNGSATLERVDDGWRLKWERVLDHPPGDVWTALTEPGRLDEWMPWVVNGTWQEGGRLTFVAPFTDDPAKEGRVLAAIRPRLLAYTRGQDHVHIELTAVRDGCRVALAVHVPDGRRCAHEAALWHASLDALPLSLRGLSTVEVLETLPAALLLWYLHHFGSGEHPGREGESPPRVAFAGQGG
jgi:uncharacterized protein YndB with AHSA1/START domain